MRFRIVALPQTGLREGTRRIEIPQARRPKLVSTVVTCEHLLHSKFGRPVGVHGRAGMGLIERLPCRDPVHGGRRREHQPTDACSAQRIDEAERRDKVPIPELRRITNRFADFDTRGEMNRGANLVFRNNLLDEGTIGNVARDETHVADRLRRSDRPAMAR